MKCQDLFGLKKKSSTAVVIGLNVQKVLVFSINGHGLFHRTSPSGMSEVLLI